MTPAATPRPTPRPAAVWLALLTVYLVWGSTYLGIRVVVGSIPPLLAMGARFLIAATLLTSYLALRHGWRVLRVPPRQVAAAGLVGGLLLLCGNGGVAVAEQTVPSGLAALLVGATPLWLVCLRAAARDRPRPRSLLGTALGFAGVAVLARPGAHGGEIKAWGFLVVLGASMCWALGSFASSRIPVPGDPLVATAWEMAIGGLGMLLAGVGRGELHGFVASDVPGKAWAWLTYLVLVGSLGGFTAYIWLLGNAPISLTATYAYVNPVVAVALGALVLAEPVTVPIMVGGAVVVLGVGLVVSSERPRRTASGPAVSPTARTTSGKPG